MGAALERKRVESWVFLGRHAGSGESLLRKGREENRGRREKGRWKGRTKILVQSNQSRVPATAQREDDKSVTEEAVAESTTEEAIPVMNEVDPEERETGHKMWLSERVATLKKEKEGLKRTLEVIGTKLSLQETTMKGVEERCAKLETAIIQIAEVAQQQNAAIESSRALMSSLVEEVNTHRVNFQKVGMIMQVHEQYIVRSGVVTQEMAQYVNALIREKEQKRTRIASVGKEYQVQSDVLRQQQEGQHVLAEVLKMMVAGRRQEQQQPHQGATETGPTVTEVDASAGRTRIFRMPRAPIQDHRTMEGSACR